MLSKHCNDCGSDAHPKLRHPSSFKIEFLVWVVAVAVGLSAGAWSAARSDGSTSLSQVFQTINLSSAQSIDQSAGIQLADNRNSQNFGMAALEWLTQSLADFLRSAWWVLPIPILFSFWRQFKKHEVCGHCGSRELVPVHVDHGKMPPVW